jgi:hypothetical protein
MPYYMLTILKYIASAFVSIVVLIISLNVALTVAAFGIVFFDISMAQAIDDDKYPMVGEFKR